ncbi:hypothetical protein VTO73DRAFT_128 [Trametes versicolor]
MLSSPQSCYQQHTPASSPASKRSAPYLPPFGGGRSFVEELTNANGEKSYDECCSQTSYETLTADLVSRKIRTQEMDHHPEALVLHPDVMRVIHTLRTQRASGFGCAGVSLNTEKHMEAGGGTDLNKGASTRSSLGALRISDDTPHYSLNATPTSDPDPARLRIGLQPARWSFLLLSSRR